VPRVGCLLPAGGGRAGLQQSTRVWGAPDPFAARRFVAPEPLPVGFVGHEAP
jgi:hypothetical protein